MSKHQPAPPCIVDVGLVVSKQDMIRVLEDLGRVSYLDIQDGEVRRVGEAYVMEVFCDPSGATMIANRTIYLNVNSFDCLQLDWPTGERPQFNLLQEGRVVRLIPATDPLEERDSEEHTQAIQQRLNTGLRSVVEEVLMESSCLCEDWDEDDDDDLDG
ncbi:MAG: hypothetical protein KME03_10870 [Aphanocapsa lilacina HA4352-LM1]|jgi:hypothetical protein|uniref:Uncharacterized protein n=1 Tax=Gloeobacter morelensis MG652769 TaxID=2781736 RepID=A0ABY3PP31_9CYAN|nr:hypothetical protein [Gloeobacter morelensis]MBW4698373.1 hypothetical protein [Aphanocapsa lilacina HA4352-LM1]UFP95380.1 hypothetical protein ISF26_03780 [Gloeobacter morelensis MG652769]